MVPTRRCSWFRSLGQAACPEPRVTSGNNVLQAGRSQVARPAWPPRLPPPPCASARRAHPPSAEPPQLQVRESWDCQRHRVDHRRSGGCQGLEMGGAGKLARRHPQQVTGDDDCKSPGTSARRAHVVLDLLNGPKRYRDLAGSLPGMGSNCRPTAPRRGSGDSGRMSLQNRRPRQRRKSRSISAAR